MPDQALDRRIVEQVGVVSNRAADAVSAIVHHYHQVQLRPAVADLLCRQAPTWRQRGKFRLLREDHLKQWIAADIRFPPTLTHNFGEWQIFMFQRVQNDGPYPSQ